MNAPIVKISRRGFLVSAGGLAVAVAFGSLPSARKAFAQAGDKTVNAWIRLGTDGTVTIQSPASEMGQGVMTAMPLLIAEEMDLDWSKVEVETSPTDFKAYGNPMFGGLMLTGASRTTRGYYDIMRLAGMQARAILLQNAARKWDEPISSLSTEPHYVVHKASGRKMSYGEIASFAVIPDDPPKFTREQLKPASQFRLIGKDVPRVDIPDKVSGKAIYGIDVRLPGMLYGAVLRAPAQGEKPEAIDESEARKIVGVRQIVRMPYGVGVVAETYPAALKARKALKVTWSKSAKASSYSSDRVRQEFLERARRLDDTGVEYQKVGDPLPLLDKASKVFSAEYTTEHVAHACAEPMNATARVDGDRIEVWAPTQSRLHPLIVLSKGLGFKQENIKLNVTLLGGGFGRRLHPDFVLDAGILAKAMPGNPVKVIWTREDDIQFSKLRPLTAQRLDAAVDAQGNLIALRHRLVSESIYATFFPPLFEKFGGRDAPVCEGAFDLAYDIPNRVLYYLREQRGIEAHLWRAVGSGYTKFALETLIDELAAAAGKDPIEYRLGLLSKQPRARGVLDEVARMADWKKPRPAGRALGVGYCEWWDTHIAEIAEVSVDRKTGAIRVHDVWAAVDCGVALQPANVATQIESSILFGVSGALKEKITIKDGLAQQTNFHDYPVLRMNEAPRVHVKVLPTNNRPGGIGEAGLPPIVPAIANAVFKLSGKRLRDLPFKTELLKA